MYRGDTHGVQLLDRLNNWSFIYAPVPLYPHLRSHAQP